MATLNIRLTDTEKTTNNRAIEIAEAVRELITYDKQSILIYAEVTKEFPEPLNPRWKAVGEITRVKEEASTECPSTHKENTMRNADDWNSDDVEKPKRTEASDEEWNKGKGPAGIGTEEQIKAVKEVLQNDTEAKELPDLPTEEMGHFITMMTSEEHITMRAIKALCKGEYGDASRLCRILEYRAEKLAESYTEPSTECALDTLECP